MYPLLLKPAMKDYLWGGTKLKDEWGFETDKDIAAEAWLLSCHKDGDGVVMNGALKGKTFSEVLSLWGKETLGERAEKFSDFPILIKFIDAKQSLSVQVHPDDEYALKNEGEFGKNEMWYIVDCEEGAELIYGFKENISKEEFERRIKDNTLPEVCNYVPVKKGDVFFIEAGTLHAIGAGILICEVQQNSNSTYRVWDFGRVGADGKPRELHIDKALDVTKCEKPTRPYGQVGEVKENKGASLRELARCELFTTGILKTGNKSNIESNESFVSLIFLDGEAEVIWNDGSITAKKGDSIFVPAGMKIDFKGQAEILYAYV